jgi:uncharacterized OB-fold protein
MTDDTRDAGYDDWLDALADGDGYYLECPEGHGSLPPRRVCPECGATDLAEEPLPATGEIEAATVVHVAAPRFADDVPYATAVADFGPVRLTGVVRDHERAEAGATVEAAVGETTTGGEPLVLLRPR